MEGELFEEGLERREGKVRPMSSRELSFVCFDDDSRERTFCYAGEKESSRSKRSGWTGRRKGEMRFVSVGEKKRGGTKGREGGKRGELDGSPSTTSFLRQDSERFVPFRPMSEKRGLKGSSDD